MTDEENIKLNREMFPNVLGQTKVLNRARFLISEQNFSGVLSPVLLCGGFGCGKNIVAGAIAAHLKTKEDKQVKPAIEVNCSSIGSLTQFFDEVVSTHLMGGEITVIFDEIHSWNGVPKILDALLTIWNTDSLINSYTFNGQTYTFDLSEISFICMTSEAHLLPESLRSRMEVIQMEELKLNELAQIVGKKLKKVKVSDDLLIDVASHGRKNGRESWKLGRILAQYAKQHGIEEINHSHWDKIKTQLSIRPDGISNMEFRILQYLNTYGSCTLSKLSSALNLTSTATRIGFESYLLANGYIEIEPPKGRKLTVKAREFLKTTKD